MRKPEPKAILSLLPLLGILFAVRPVFATPYVDITADWAVGSFMFFPSDNSGGGALPSGLAISCFGGASGGGAAGCSDSRTLDQTVLASQTLSLDATSGLTITNNTGQAIDGTLYFTTVFASFDPSNSLGVGVDSLTNDNASFSASVLGTGVASANSCSLGAGPGVGCVLLNGLGGALFTEAVWSPDTSQDFTGIDLSLAPGASQQLSYTIDIGADFTVPEPSSLMLLASGILLLSLLCFPQLDHRAFWRNC